MRHELEDEDEGTPSDDVEGIGYWKISPGESGVFWESWLSGSCASIGWDELGDIGRLTKAEFEKRAEEVLKEHQGWKRTALLQVWTFSRIPAGSRIVANRGTTEVLGIGEVTGSYYFVPEPHSHRLPVKWIDTHTRAISRLGWRKTLIRIDEETFNEVSEAEQKESEDDPAIPVETVRATEFRALERPLLEVLRDRGGSRTDIFDRLLPRIRDHLLPGDMRLMPNGRPVWRYRAGWALFGLKSHGLAKSPKANAWDITDRGQEILEKEQPPSFAQFQNSQVKVRTDDAALAPKEGQIKPAVRADDRSWFRDTRYDVESVLLDIKRGDLALPDLQRPFVWDMSKVRKLFDSMYRGFPIGSLMFWATQGNSKTRSIGVDEKQREPNRLVIDGQQRLTALYAVIRGEEVLDKNFQNVTLKIAFRPRDGDFKVGDARTEGDPEYFRSITELWRSQNPFGMIDDFADRLRQRRRIADGDVAVIKHNLNAVYRLAKYPLVTIEIDKEASEEAVADIFVRINSEGSRLVQSDFILTLMSVFSPDTRRRLEEFSRRSALPAMAGEASPYNQVIKPKPNDLVRVAVALGFQRARLSAVYKLLRGKNPETEDVAPEERDGNFRRLEEAVGEVLDLTHWHLFLDHMRGAGFRSGDLVSSENAILYAYSLYLFGRLHAGVAEKPLGRLIAQWAFFVSLTARYSGSTETVMEEDLQKVAAAKTPEEFERVLAGLMDSVLTHDFWEAELVSDLDTSNLKSPAALAFRVAQIRLGGPALFSDDPIFLMFDPAIQSKRKVIELHHLFPKSWLRSQGIEDRSEINQVANVAIVEWPDNADVSSAAPSDYVPRQRAHFSPEKWADMCAFHALPQGWETMSYPEFLAKRRPLIAQMIRRGFEHLGGKESPDDVRRFGSADETQVWKMIEEVERALRSLVRAKYKEKWGTGADARLLKIFSEKELADLEVRRAKHRAAYPLSPGEVETGEFLDYLFMGDLAKLVTASETWDKFSQVFDGRKDLLQRKLQEIMPVRNDRAHFRSVPEKELERCRIACDDLLVMFRKADLAPKN